MSNSLHRRHKQTLVVMLKLLVVMGLNWISEVRAIANRVDKKLFFLNQPSFFLLCCAVATCKQWLIQTLWNTYLCTVYYLFQRRSIWQTIETVRFFRLFTREGDIEHTGCGNTEHRGLKAREYCPDCHLAQISWRKGAAEHVLHCNESLKGVAIPRVGQKSIPWNWLLGSLSFYKFWLKSWQYKVCSTVVDKYAVIAELIQRWQILLCQILHRIGHISNN